MPPKLEMPSYIVRHGAMRFLGIYLAPPSVPPLRRGEGVILATDRGQEFGEVLTPSTPQLASAIIDATRGSVLRVVTEADAKKLDGLKVLREATYTKSVELVREHKLDMQIVDVEHIFGGERLTIYFISENRIDFRELVKSLAKEFRTRIELRQIGVRDEAKLLADYGDCGRPVCCNSFLAVMPPVSMRMAKIQKATLDPNKISGRCGRLKCCLRYEQDVYEEHQKELPPVGSRVVTKIGQGRVLAQELLAKRLLIEFEDGRRLPILADEVLTRL